MDVQEIQKRCKIMRKQILEMTYRAGVAGAHVGGSLSLVEIMAVLYLDVMRYDKDCLTSDMRDRMIFSKGHGAMALYAAMEQAGILAEGQLQTFKQDGSLLSAHPSKNAAYGIEFSSGSLGQGLSLGAGTALALRRKNHPARVFVILGDGECDEGSVWEAAMFAAQYRLHRLIAVVDYNKLQYDGEIKSVMALDPISEKWESFGWNVIRVDGHSVEALLRAFRNIEGAQRPTVVIADTIKGKGVSFMENQPAWHNGALRKDLFEKAMDEVMEE